MNIVRSQLPVGQGCFHAASMSLEEGSSRLHYVYDCGSDTPRHLRRQIVRYRTYTPSIDALFVSHFHADHVSGLDELLGTLRVETVYIPYVSDLVLLLDIVEADMEANLSGSLIEITFNPESWFGRRGVQRVVRISPGPPNLAVLGEQVEPNPEDDRLRFVESPAATRVSPARLGRAPVRAELLKMDPGGVGVHALGRFTGWALVPYVHPASVAGLSVFKRKLRSALNLPSRKVMSSQVLAAALCDRSTRKAIQRCYEAIIPGGSSRLHNRTSLSLYSGPTRQIEGDVRLCHGPFPYGIPELYPFNRFWMCRVHPEALGWIGAGDADLNTTRVREEWQRAYRGVGSQVGTLLLPHHGSWRNFHPDLLDFPNLELCVASAARPSRYKHPSEETIGEINQRRKVFVHVSQHVESELVEKIEVP